MENNIQLYRACLLKQNDIFINHVVPIQKAFLGRNVIIEGYAKAWEIRGICSAVMTHHQMLQYINDKESIEDKVDQNEHESTSK